MEDTPKIKEMRFWSPQLVRDLCVQSEFYTCGTNSEYEEMLEFVRNHEPEKENLYKVAVDILNHSSDEVNCSLLDSDMMAMLMNRTVVYDYFID